MLNRFSVIEMWVDHPHLGCGERRLIVVRIGRVWVDVLDPATLAKVALDRRMVESRAQVVEPGRRLKGIIRRNLSERKKLGLRSSARAAKEALAAL